MGNLNSIVYGADYTNWRASAIDYTKVYYDLGYTDGSTAGDLVGAQDGYNLTYPVAYAKAYPVGHAKGIVAGIADGTAAGSTSGYSEGYSAGQTTGYDSGFTAGVQYHLFGKYNQPVYALNYVNRATGPAPVPEPSSLLLMGVTCALGLGLFRRQA